MAAVVVAGLTGLGGCGEKIAIPEPAGLFGVRDYLSDTLLTVPQAVQLEIINNNLFILASSGELAKRDQDFGEISLVEGLDNPTALCQDDASQLVFVWEQGSRRVSVYSSTHMNFLNATELPEVQSCVALCTCEAGIDSVASARTFLYLSDPDSGVVHRYAYDDFAGLTPHGLMARSDGDGARFVHVPAGMCRDIEDSLLICDADTLRNWIIRFNPQPDYTDVTVDPDDQDPWRGKAILFNLATCEPPAAADYTLGDAAECQETGWSGGPSSAEGEFTRPLGLDIDGSGRIYVADEGNDRVQIFTPEGYYEMLFGTEETIPGPASVGVVDIRIGSGEDDINYGAYVYVLLPETGQVRKFISYEHYIWLNQELPPDPG